ncbi:MAG TPA: secretin N-terminal domain-containing protein, partial [Armatimonadaceae bacterium]|nr:secretin N-terminal domain-containing protein [Armatimonadaceae bacterium]
MKLRRTLTTILAVAALQSVAFAQFPFDDDPPTPAWEQFTLDPKVRVKLDFRNASIDAILQALSEASGVTIVKDPALNGGLTLQSPKQQSLADAFAQLNAVLGLKNYEIQREGNFLIIRARQQRFGGFGGRSGGSDGTNGGVEGFGGRSGRGGDSSDTMLRVYQIKYANASQVARVLNEVFAGSGVPSVQPQPQQQRTGQAGDSSPVQVAQRGGGRGGFGGFGGGGGQRFGGRTGTISANSVVRASADDFSNSVIVNAPSREQEQVQRLIEQIDKQTEQPQQSRVFNLQFASATDLAPVVQNVLISNVPRGRGGFSASTGTPIDQRFGGGGAARFGAAASAIGTVVPELRTNALVVTTTADNLATIEKVIEELDKEVEFENSSFVVTLENARADQMATLLNQSFGGRVGGQGQGFGGTRTQQNRNQAQRTTTGGNRGNRAGGGGRALG